MLTLIGPYLFALHPRQQGQIRRSALVVHSGRNRKIFEAGSDVGAPRRRFTLRSSYSGSAFAGTSSAWIGLASSYSANSTSAAPHLHSWPEVALRTTCRSAGQDSPGTDRNPLHQRAVPWQLQRVRHSQCGLWVWPGKYRGRRPSPVAQFTPNRRPLN